MTNDNVVQFSGVTRLPLDPDMLLKAAIGELDEVVILGFDKEGNEYFASSKAGAAEVIYACERVKHKLNTILDGADE